MQRRTPLRRKTPLRQRTTGSSTQAPLRSRGLRPIPAAVRAAVVLRDGGCCVVCGRSAVHLHHAYHTRGAGGPDAPWNLACVCVEHHQAAHDSPEVKRRIQAILRARGIVPPEV